MLEIYGSVILVAASKKRNLEILRYSGVVKIEAYKLKLWDDRLA
jgi:hypothetical protein